MCINYKSYSRIGCLHGSSKTETRLQMAFPTGLNYIYPKTVTPKLLTISELPFSEKNSWQGVNSSKSRDKNNALLSNTSISIHGTFYLSRQVCRCFSWSHALRKLVALIQKSLYLLISIYRMAVVEMEFVQKGKKELAVSLFLVGLVNSHWLSLLHSAINYMGTG